jgi:hypothetical protein
VTCASSRPDVRNVALDATDPADVLEAVLVADALEGDFRATSVGQMRVTSY